MERGASATFMIRFTKMHGLGNDFVVIDAINQAVNLKPEQIRSLSERHLGIGFDQLLLVEKPVSANAQFKYRIFNADGSEVSQCGNGARCFGRFIRDHKLFDGNLITVDTNAGQLVLILEDDGMVTVNMGIPKHAPIDIPMLAPEELPIYSLVINEMPVKFDAVSMGNPHAVMLVRDIEEAPVEKLGQIMESHPIFPERANIGFMQVMTTQHIKLRVYERGAGETRACGSGACAAVVVGIEQNLLSNKVNVDLPGGRLIIKWAGRGHPVYMKGPATSVFEGTIAL
jgi:diaminopimelate epimerase